MTDNLRICSNILLLMFFSACTVTVNGPAKIYTGANIDDDVRTEIHHYAEYILNSAQKKDARYIASLMPKGRHYIDTINSILKHLYLDAGNSTLNTVGEFYIKDNSRHNPVDSVMSSVSGNKYVYRFQPQSSETYIYMFYTPDTSQRNDILVSLEFNKVDKKWMLNTFHFGLFLHDNKAAPQFVYEAFDEYLHDSLLTAAYDMSITRMMTYPAGQKFRYEDESNILRMMDECVKKLNEEYKFPFTIETLDSKPVIYQLKTSDEYGHAKAVITYQSKLIAYDKNAAEEENRIIHYFRDVLFPGLTTFGDTVVYRVLSDTTANASFYFVHKSNADPYIDNKTYMETYVLPNIVDSSTITDLP